MATETLLPALAAFDARSPHTHLDRSRKYALINQGELPPPVKIGKSYRLAIANIDSWLLKLLIRPDEVLSRIFDMPVLKVANHPLGRLLQHRHMFCGRLT